MSKKRVKKTKAVQCSIPGCDREAVHKKAKLCNRCYHWMNYWRDRSPTDIMERVHQIEFWQKRFTVLTPQNVVKLRKKA